MKRYNFFGITMEVYLVAGLFAAALAIIVFLAYREAGAARRRTQHSGSEGEA